MFYQFLALLLAGLLLAGCSTNQQIFSENGSVFYSSQIPSGVIQDFRKRVNANGLLEVALVLRSSTGKSITYKIEWLDADGFVLRSSLDGAYQSVRLEPNQELVLNKIASDRRARDFRIEIQSDYKNYR